MLGIPQRVYLVSQLSRGLDKLIEQGALEKYKPTDNAPKNRMEVGRLTAVVAESGVKNQSPEPPLEAITEPIELSKPRPKTWNEIKAEVECKKGRPSKSCTIL